MENKLQVIEYQNQRVLTTQQLADSYNTEPKVISKNFSNNQKRYKDNKHYYCIKDTI